jgi:hypothetical protein
MIRRGGRGSGPTPKRTAFPRPCGRPPPPPAPRRASARRWRAGRLAGGIGTRLAKGQRGAEAGAMALSRETGLPGECHSGRDQETNRVYPPLRDGALQAGRSGNTAGRHPTRRARSARRGRGGRWPGALAPGGPGPREPHGRGDGPCQNMRGLPRATSGNRRRAGREKNQTSGSAQDRPGHGNHAPRLDGRHCFLTARLSARPSRRHKALAGVGGIGRARFGFLVKGRSGKGRAGGGGDGRLCGHAAAVQRGPSESHGRGGGTEAAWGVDGGLAPPMERPA